MGPIRRNPAVFGLLALISAGVSIALDTLGHLPEPRPENDLLSILRDVSAIVAIYSPLITFPLIQGAAIHAAGIDLAGRRSPFRDCVRAGLSRYATLLVMFAVTILGLGFGLALIIPVVWVVSTLAVVGPVSALETPELELVLQRSFVLTRGNRLRILGASLVLALCALVFGLLLIFVEEALRPFAGDPGVGVVASLGASIDTVLAATANAALYFELQRIVGHSSREASVAAAEAMAA